MQYTVQDVVDTICDFVEDQKWRIISGKIRNELAECPICAFVNVLCESSTSIFGPDGDVARAWVRAFGYASRVEDNNILHSIVTAADVPDCYGELRKLRKTMLKRLVKNV